MLKWNHVGAETCNKCDAGGLSSRADLPLFQIANRGDVLYIQKVRGHRVIANYVHFKC